MTEEYDLFLRVLRAALRGEKLVLDDSIRAKLPGLYQLAAEHRILPLIADCLYDETQEGVARQAREAAAFQALRTANFLLLLEGLDRQGLRPLVVKGVVCRSLYPKPELRPSSDEDLLILPAEYGAYKAFLTDRGLSCIGTESAHEVGYVSADRDVYLELHTSLFPPDSDAYGDCNRFFDGVFDRAVEQRIEGVPIRTLAPTDHLLLLICHAYKHFLHGGVGIRQVCDINLMAEKEAGRIDWAYIRKACEELHLAVFTAGLFRIGEKHLGFVMPEAFADLSPDEADLLDDILSGGLYGVNDIDRAHSSTMTLEAVAASRSGMRRRGALHAVFLPLEAMRGKYPYLKKLPWLLPAAWVQRIWQYIRGKNSEAPVNPSRSVRIARERIELLKKYGITD